MRQKRSIMVLARAAKDMHLKFTEAKGYIDKNEYQKGYEAVNSAYFDY